MWERRVKEGGEGGGPGGGAGNFREGGGTGGDGRKRRWLEEKGKE